MLTSKAQLEAAAKKHGGTLIYQRLDVTNSQAIPEAFASLVPGLRYPIRGLVACAGVSDNDPAHEFSVERFRRLMEINVTGNFAVAQAVALEMKKADVSGSMVLVASMSGTNVNKVCVVVKSHTANRPEALTTNLHFRALTRLPTTHRNQAFFSSLDRWRLSGVQGKECLSSE